MTVAVKWSTIKQPISKVTYGFKDKTGCQMSVSVNATSLGLIKLFKVNVRHTMYVLSISMFYWQTSHDNRKHSFWMARASTLC